MRMIGVAGPVPAAELRVYRALLTREDGGRAFLRIMRAFERTPAFEDRIVAALAAREFPAAVAWGEDDPALPVRTHGEDVRRALAVDEIVRLPGRHFVPEDAPDEIAALVAGLAAAA